MERKLCAAILFLFFGLSERYPKNKGKPSNDLQAGITPEVLIQISA